MWILFSRRLPVDVDYFSIYIEYKWQVKKITHVVAVKSHRLLVDATVKVAVNPDAPKKNTINGYREDANLEGVVLLGGGRGLLATFIHKLRAVVRLVPLWLFRIPSTGIITH